MPLSKVTITVAGGGVGRRPINRDKVTGILFHAASYPSGFGASAQYKRGYTLQDFVTLGITQADATFGPLWYQISEYFRINPIGELWVGVCPANTTFVEIQAMAIAAGGDIRQMGVWSSARVYAANVATDVATCQAQADLCAAGGYPLSIILATNCAAVATGWGAAVNLRAGNANSRVSYIIAQDGGAAGDALYVAKTFSIPALGAALGAISKALVSGSIGNPTNFNVSNGVELETIALTNRDKGSVLSDALLGTLKDTGYLILRKYLPRVPGSFFERVPTSVLSTDDYAWLEYKRTVDKAIRGVDSALTPLLQSPLALKSNGQMRDDVIGFFKDSAGAPLIAMKAAGEISDFAVLIDPTQNVQTSSTLALTVKILPIGVAEFITVNIGLTTAI